MQETSLRDQEALPARSSRGDEPKVALVVDRPSPTGRSVLILPFAAQEEEMVFGRQVGLILQQRLQLVPHLATGLAHLIAVNGSERYYLSLLRPLSRERALACGGRWGATAVLYGALTLQPELRWDLVLQEVATGQVIFEDTLTGATIDILDAPGDVAQVVAEAMGLSIDAEQRVALAVRETTSLDALAAYLQGADMRPQHGLTHADSEEMRRCFLRALSLDPAFSIVASALITDSFSAAAGPDAFAAFIACMRALGSEGVAGAVALARILEGRGQVAQAADLSTAALDQEPSNILALEIAAQHAQRAGQSVRARSLVNTLLDRQPEHAAGHELLGDLLATVGRLPGAAQQWEIALELDAARHHLLLRLGMYLAAAGDYERAYYFLQQATILGHATSDSLYQLAKLAYRLDLMPEAISTLYSALQEDPGRSKGHALLARCYQRAGREDLALVHDRRALELQPGHWPSALAIGHAALARNQISEALTAFTQVARARPDLPEALYGWGVALLGGQMVADAVDVLARAHELRPDDLLICCTLAMAYLSADRLVDAARTVAYAVTLAPRSPMVARCVSALRRVRDEQTQSMSF